MAELKPFCLAITNRGGFEMKSEFEMMASYAKQMRDEIAWQNNKSSTMRNKFDSHLNAVTVAKEQLENANKSVLQINQMAGSMSEGKKTVTPPELITKSNKRNKIIF